jgi:ribosomal protein S18 acetylase RimI-like enzyme
MDEIVEIFFARGPLRLRPEHDEDQAFRFRLFCDSRPPEWDMVQIAPALREQLMQHQFRAQTASYRAQFPNARFDIIECEGESIGRIVVDRPGGSIRIVDQAIVPTMRNRTVATTIMCALLGEATRAGVPVRLKVASNNGAAMRLYLRLGFVATGSDATYVDMERQPSPTP